MTDTKLAYTPNIITVLVHGEPTRNAEGEIISYWECTASPGYYAHSTGCGACDCGDVPYVADLPDVFAEIRAKYSIEPRSSEQIENMMDWLQ